MDHQIFNIGSASSYTYASSPSPTKSVGPSLTKNPSLNNIQQLNSNNLNLFADIQAQLELSIELRRFINIDLFQRGYYQIRISVKLSNKQVPVKILLQLENAHTNQNLSDVMFPSTVLDDCAVSKTFLILYRNEEINLDDQFLFKISTLLNAFNLIESFEKLGLELNLELWFTESDYKPPSLNTLYSSAPSKISPSNSSTNLDSNSTAMQLLCCRTFKIKFDPRHGIHLQLPCIFDYFHLSSVLVTIHCSLLTLLPPVMLGTNLQRNLTLSSILFGKDLSQFKSPTEVSASLLNRAVHLHNLICTLLLAAYESLQDHMFKMMSYMSEHEKSKIKVEFVDCKDKQRKLCQIIQNCNDPESIDDLANRHVAQCSAENIMLWCLYLDNFSLNQTTSPYLATEYHNKRLKRFSETFICKDMPKRLLTDYLHEYAQITDLFTGLNEMIRQSAYYQQLPDLIVGCDDLDGVADQLPIIFEEIYVSDSEYNESCKMSLASFRSDSNIRTRRQYERKTSHSSNEFSSSSSNPADSKLQKRLRKKALNTGDSVHAYSNSNKSIQLVSYKKKDEYSTDSVFSSEPDLASQSNHQEKLSKIRAELDTKQPASNLSSTKTQLSTVCSLFQDNKCVDTNSVNANIASASDLLFGTDKQDVTLALDSIELSEIDSSFTSLSDNSNVVCTPQSIKNGPSDASYKSKALYESFRGKISTLERPKMYGNMRKSLLNHSYSLDEQKSRKNSAQSNSSDPVRLSVNRECLTMEDECTPVPPVRHKKLLNRQLSLEQNHNILEKNSLSNFMSPSLVKFVQQREDLRKMLNQKYPLSNIYSQFSSNFCAWPYFYAELMPPLPLPIARPTTALSIRRNSTRSSFMSTLTSKSKLLNKMLGTSIDTIGQQDNSSEFEYDEDDQQHQDEKVHLVVCVHGLDGNSGDLRLVRTYLELALPGAKMDFLMSEQNQENTFDDIEIMTEQLIKEIQLHLDNYGIDPDRISFIGHSLGNLIIRSTVSHEKFKPYVNKLYTYLSLSGPHLGTLYNSSGLINMGLWLMQKWKKSGSLLQLSLKDNADLYKTFLYKLSRKKTFEHFKNVLLVASPQDRYVPFHSARVDMCKSAFKDSVYGTIYREMVTNMLKPIRDNPAINFRRYSAFYSLPNGTSNLIGRAAHVAVLDSEFFVEKLVLVSVAKYFR